MFVKILGINQEHLATELHLGQILEFQNTDNPSLIPDIRPPASSLAQISKPDPGPEGNGKSIPLSDLLSFLR